MIQPTKEIYKLALELACRNAGKNFQYNRDTGYYIQWAERIITEKKKEENLRNLNPQYQSEEQLLYKSN
jgi:hypothetical protein